jgi:hypothetical protein
VRQTAQLRAWELRVEPALQERKQELRELERKLRERELGPAVVFERERVAERVWVAEQELARSSQA